MEDLLKQILSELKNVNNRLDKVETEINGVKSQTSESTQILKALEHNSQVHKAEMDNLAHTVAELSGDVKSIKTAIVKSEETYDIVQKIKEVFSK